MAKYYFWWLCIILGIIHAAYAANIRLYLTDGPNPSLDKYVVTTVENSLSLVPYLTNNTMNITVYTHGFDGKTNGPVTTLMLNAYMNANRYNYTGYLMMYDWEKEAKSFLTDLSYVKVREILVPKVGALLGEFLYKLNINGVLNLVRLVGHSLGAHLHAYAARKFYELTSNTMKISRITGLDPAGPLSTKSNSLQASDAEFVDVLHTNPYGYGTSKSLGTVDFWANCNNNITQPGCPSDPLTLLDKDERMCSHNRACYLYAEVLGSPDAFQALCVSSCTAWRNQSEATTQINYLGEKVDPTKPGNCFFSTKSSSPYSKGDSGQKPN